MRRNGGNSSLRRRRRPGDPMEGFDRLPAELRGWLREAALPWSAQSALRVWRRVLAETGGDVQRARLSLDRVQARRLSRDALAVWGPGHPASAP
ncbi:DUF6525 family protein [Albibacillus kandeliae]|uniref:DUF6525 family protein n=1 Tax=Albibacillus kandeliae TaxID=2174228 RepID=UPI000D696B3E|nr:DUF6525 family protein [Albibacillus kandeliae]